MTSWEQLLGGSRNLPLANPRMPGFVLPAVSSECASIRGPERSRSPVDQRKNAVQPFAPRNRWFSSLVSSNTCRGKLAGGACSSSWSIVRHDTKWPSRLVFARIFINRLEAMSMLNDEGRAVAGSQWERRHVPMLPLHSTSCMQLLEAVFVFRVSWTTIAVYDDIT